MNSEKFLHLVAEPNKVSKKDTEKLHALLDEFPYFQAARVLHLKGLKNQSSYKYNKALKQTAAFTTNRTVLFDFITKDTLDFDTASKNEQQVLSEIQVVDSKIIDHLNQSINAASEQENEEPEMDKEASEKVTDVTAVESNNTKETIQEKVEMLEINRPIDFKKEDRYSFNEWLQLNAKKQIKREATYSEERLDDQKEIVNEGIEVEESNEVKSEENEDLIAKFIKNNPKIKPVKGSIKQNLAEDSITENSSLMTETLARVYLEQKKYKKAISAFKILSLKYPEKSSFFADRIKAIQFLEKYKS